MKQKRLTLDCLPLGGKAHVTELNVSGVDRRRMLDLGLLQGATIEALSRSPSGDPVAYFVRGTVIALRCEDAQKITVTECM